MTATTADRAPARLIHRTELRRLAQRLPPMGAQPALDGIRAVSVALVILYHAGFARVHGGFFGVEVFFVVSGYLITSLLWEERSRNGRVSLRHFWLRRARRLLPALFVVLAASTAWAVWFADEHLELLRRDLLPALLYVGNWGQIFGSVPYFSPADPVLRHVWSLAVEEQWYLVWPLLFIGLMRLTRSHARVMAALLAGAAVSIAAWSAFAASSTRETITFAGRHPDRFNFLYLNTFTRSSGLLLGAALALVWRPWSRRRMDDEPSMRARRDGVIADVVGITAVAGIVVIAITRGATILADASLYQRWLPMVTVLSAIAVATSVHPQARSMRLVFGNRAIVAIGQRSYGLYLWHWPVFVFAGVRSDHSRFLPAMLLTCGLSELCYRLIETPVRRGAIGRWWAQSSARRHARRRIVAGACACALGVVGLLGARVVAFEPTDPALDERDVAFDPLAAAPELPAASAAGTSTPSASDDAPGSSTAAPAISAVPGGVATTVVATAESTTTLPTLPRPLVIVGDSMAHALAINLPSGIDDTFTIADGSLDGCGIWDAGSVVSRLSTFRRSFSDCAGWQDKWARSVTRSGAQLALVVIGAWDVFDVRVGDTLVPFGSAQSDDLFRQHLQSGIDAVVAAGAHVALLEVACMRPVDVKGAGVPALPERGDDARVAHVNELLRAVAAANPDTVTFVPGPTAWCGDPTIATNLGYRWDGVHVYKPGAKLIFETIAASLLSIPL